MHAGIGRYPSPDAAPVLPLNFRPRSRVLDLIERVREHLPDRSERFAYGLLYEVSGMLEELPRVICERDELQRTRGFFIGVQRRRWEVN